jgi:lipopolysaccharide export system protein LptA
MMRALLISALLFAAPVFAEDTILPPPEFQEETPAAEKAAPEKPAGPLAALGKPGDSEYLDITADQSLEWHETESVYIARGHAVAKRGELKVEADILKAHNRKKPDGSSEIWKLEAEGNVKISDPRHTASGDKGIYDIDSKKATLTGENLRFSSGEDTVTAQKSFEYSEKESKIIAHGDVEALREGRKVKADEMIAWLAPAKKKSGQDIEKLEAKGNVHIVTKEDAVFCNQAVYNLAKNTATLTGKVRITRGPNQLKGDKVEADFKTGQSKLINTGGGRVSALIGGNQGKPGANKPPSSETSIFMPVKP